MPSLPKLQLTLTDGEGNVLNNASVAIYHEIAGSPVATPYANRDGTGALGVPYTAPNGADAGCFLAPGEYKVVATQGNFTRTWRYVAVGLSAAAVTGLSTSSLSVGTGSKSFTVEAGLGFALGQRLRAASDDATKIMEGEVTAYSGTTLTIDVDYTEGSGTHADWNISITGMRGSATVTGTSSTNNSVSTGSKTFATQASLGWTIGTRIRAASTDSPPSKIMDGEVTNYSGTSVTIDVDFTEGSGSNADWDLSIVGPRGPAGSAVGLAIVSILVFDDSQNCATGDGAGDVFWRVPSALNGFNLVDAQGQAQTAGVTGTMDIQVARIRAGAAVDMLSTKLTIDSTEIDTATAATPAVINGSNDDVSTGDQIRIDVDAVHTTPAKGLLVELKFQAP